MYTLVIVSNEKITPRIVLEVALGASLFDALSYAASVAQWLGFEKVQNVSEPGHFWASPLGDMAIKVLDFS